MAEAGSELLSELALTARTFVPLICDRKRVRHVTYPDFSAPLAVAYG